MPLPVPKKQRFRYPNFSNISWQKKMLVSSINSLTRSDRAQIIRALKYATLKHKNQYRIGSGRKYPYIVHPVRVFRILRDDLHAVDINALIASLLHDVVEDCGVKVPELRKLFGAKVANIVKNLSENEFSGREEYMRHLPTTIPSVRQIKIADRYDNLSALEAVKSWTWKQIDSYLSETEEFILPVAKENVPVIYRKLQVLIPYLRRVKRPKPP